MHNRRVFAPGNHVAVCAAAVVAAVFLLVPGAFAADGVDYREASVGADNSVAWSTKSIDSYATVTADDMESGA